MDKIEPAATRTRPNVALRTVQAVVNAASGSVGADAARRLTEILDGFDVEAKVANVQPNEIAAAVKAAVDAKPDLLIVLAGDGTAGLAAGLCGMDGPLVAPLPGGTMNMLPHALYGRRSWPDALTAALNEGVVRTISGGEIAGQAFYVAAILGAPAMLATAREAIRKRRYWLAFMRARHTLSRCFVGSLRYSLNAGPRHKVEALTLMCPLVSKALKEDTGLEAAALDPHSAGEVFRLGLHTLFGDWRNDPSVKVELTTSGRAWARGRIPAILDGEPHRLDSPVSIAFRPQAFRALAAIPGPEVTQAAQKEGDREGAMAALGTVANGPTGEAR